MRHVSGDMILSQYTRHLSIRPLTTRRKANLVADNGVAIVLPALNIPAYSVITCAALSVQILIDVDFFHVSNRQRQIVECQDFDTGQRINITRSDFGDCPI